MYFFDLSHLEKGGSSYQGLNYIESDLKGYENERNPREIDVGSS